MLGMIRNSLWSKSSTRGIQTHSSACVPANERAHKRLSFIARVGRNDTTWNANATDFWPYKLSPRVPHEAGADIRDIGKQGRMGRDTSSRSSA